MVGLLHSMTPSGRPLTNTTMSGMTCFFDPSTLYCRLTIHSLRFGLSKSRSLTVWLLRPSPRSCSSAIPYAALPVGERLAVLGAMMAVEAQR